MTPPARPTSVPFPTRAWYLGLLGALPAASAAYILFDKKLSVPDLHIALPLLYSYALCGLLILRRALGRNPAALLVWGLGINLARLAAYACLVFLLQPILQDRYDIFLATCGGGFLAILTGEVLGLHQAGLAEYGHHE